MNKQQQPTIVQAVPIQPQIQVIQPQVNEPSLKIRETYRYAKSVKLFATIEAFFLIIYGFYSPWFFLQAIGPIAGYYGAKKFNKCLSYFYFTYLILAFFSKLIILSLTFQNYDYFYLVFSFFIMLIDIWIMKISTAFIHYLHEITEDERKNLQHIRIVTTIHYW
jgi:uncharacterized membrane protein